MAPAASSMARNINSVIRKHPPLQKFSTDWRASFRFWTSRAATHGRWEFLVITVFRLFSWICFLFERVKTFTKWEDTIDLNGRNLFSIIQKVSLPRRWAGVCEAPLPTFWMVGYVPLWPSMPCFLFRFLALKTERKKWLMNRDSWKALVVIRWLYLSWTQREGRRRRTVVHRFLRICFRNGTASLFWYGIVWQSIWPSYWGGSEVYISSHEMLTQLSRRLAC